MAQTQRHEDIIVFLPPFVSVSKRTRTLQDIIAFLPRFFRFYFQSPM